MRAGRNSVQALCMSDLIEGELLWQGSGASCIHTLGVSFVELVSWCSVVFESVGS